MPSSSENQHRAMEAAAHGNSTLGIPKKVGEEFVAKDATAGIAAGVMFVAPDGSILFVRRSQDEANYAGYWALPGGKADGDETPEAAADREAMEEIGFPVGKKKVIDQRITPNGMAFHTFASAVNDKIAPTLNGEHDGFIWGIIYLTPSAEKGSYLLPAEGADYEPFDHFHLPDFPALPGRSNGPDLSGKPPLALWGGLPGLF